jgi:NAD(P)H-dependent FMN reductase
VSLVVVSSGDSATSKTRALAGAALRIGRELHVGRSNPEGHDGGTDPGGLIIDLIDLPADALLGRRQDDGVDAAVATASAASVLVLATPVYRATFNGTLKAFLDRFGTDALARTAVVLMATAATPAHFLSLDTGGRSVVASLGGWTVPTVVYAVGADFTDGHPGDAIVATVRIALQQAASLAATFVEPA